MAECPHPPPRSRREHALALRPRRRERAPPRGDAGIAASTSDTEAINRRDPGGCLAEYLDHPVAPYTLDQPLLDTQIVEVGDADWQVIATPGPTAGYLCLWQPDQRLLASLQRLMDLAPLVLVPAHGPIPTDTRAALTTALRRTQRLVDDPAGAVW